VQLSRILAVILSSSLVCALALACQPAATPPAAANYVFRLSLKLDTEQARVCERDCMVTAMPQSQPYLQCLSQCPGTELRDAEVCGALDRKPEVACHVVEVAPHQDAEGNTLFDIIGVVATVARTAVELAAEGSARPARLPPPPLPSRVRAAPEVVPSGRPPAKPTVGP
jgi:hypothetical protein